MKRVKRVKVPESHFHLAFFGSEMCCSICNPICYKKHIKMRRDGNPNFFNWCGDKNCPSNPKKFKKR